MFGIILAFVSSIFREAGTSIGKSKALQHKESIYTMGFLNLFWAVIFFFGYALFIRGEFIFLLASLPTFGVRLILEVIQAHVTMKAIVASDRSTFGFLRIWTLPLLLGVDIFLGYTIGLSQMLGISVIIVAFIFLFINHGIKRKGAGLVIFTAINAVATISLFKYNITHFNSVEAEQGLVALVLLVYFFFMARYIAKERPLLDFMRQPVFFFQSFAMGIAGVLMSFAYVFAPASVITSAKRSLTVLTSTISGNLYFREKRFFVKIIAFLLIALGIVLLAV